MCRAALILMVLVLAAPLSATSFITYSPDDTIENPRTCSANEQYCLIWRAHAEVPDFGSVRADTIFDFPEKDDVPDNEDFSENEDFPENEDYRLKEPASAWITGAFYAGRRLVGTITIARSHWAKTFVSDSGRYVVLTTGQEDALASTDRYMVIYRFDRQRVDEIEAGRIFTPNDLAGVNRLRGWAAIRLALEDGREVAILQLDDRLGGGGEIRIDLATATRLGEMRDIYPAPRVWLTPAGFIPPHRRHTWTANDCKEVPPSARIASKQLHARAVSLPLPHYPTVAWKARIAGSAWVELTVSETGEVLCSRAIGLPFGITEAALAAARTWKFEPYLIDGAPVKFTSELELHFGILNEVAWREVTQNHEP